MPMERVDLTMLAREAIVEQMPLAEARGVDLGLLAGENSLFVTGQLEIGRASCRERV